MISIVVCSVNSDLLEKFKENIASTINCDYEILAFNNNILNKSICAVYNMGTAAAKYDIIAYCHEDIIFNTLNWNLELCELLEDETVGLVGIIGTTYKSQYPTSWANIPSSYYRPNVVKEHKKLIDINFDTEKFSQVAVVDGCFICGRKKIFLQFSWNETYLKGFHMYDIDICLQVGFLFKIIVSNTISIKHLSDGKMDNNWLLQSEIYHHRYKSNFPLSIRSIRADERNAINYDALRCYFFTASHFDRTLFERLKILIQACLLLPFKKDNLRMVKSLFK